MAIVEFNPRNFSPLRKAVQLSTARYILAPIYLIHNRLVVTGRENVPKDGPLLIVANHLSYFDPPVLVIATDRPMGFVAKEELFQSPFFKRLIEFYGAVSINRGKPELSSFKSVKRIFKAGWSVGMFIEGTRNRTPGILGRPHPGAAYFARANKVPILPVGLIGTNVSWGKAYAHIGKPMEPGQNLEETTWRVMEALSQLTNFAIEDRRLADDLDGP